MIRKDTIQRVKQEINDIKRSLKIAQNDIIRACQLSKDSRPGVLEMKEKRYRTMRRKLSELQESLNSMLEGQEPEKIQGRNLRRPANESRLTRFCEV